MGLDMSGLSPADEARSEVVAAVLRCLREQYTSEASAESAIEMLDLAAVRLCAELEAERGWPT